MVAIYFPTSTVLMGTLALCLGLAAPLARDETHEPSDTQVPKSEIRIDRHGVLAFSSDVKMLAIADRGLHLYDLITGREVAHLGWPSDSTCRYLAFSPNGRLIVSAHEGNLIGAPDLYVYLWEISPEKKLRRVAQLLTRNRKGTDYFTDVHYASFSPDNRSVVAGSADETIYIWDCVTAKERLRLHGGVAAAFTADGQTLLAVGHDGLVRHFEAASGKELPLPKNFVRSDFIFTGGVALSTSGDRIAIWDDYQVLLLDSQNGQRVCRLIFPGGRKRVTLSADGRYLIVADDVGIWFFDAITGRELGWRNEDDPEFDDAGIALSGKHRTLIWVAHKKQLRIQPLQDVLAGCIKGPSDICSDSPDVPLQADLIARNGRFVVNLGKLTPEKFSSKMTRSLPFDPDPTKPSHEDGTTNNEKVKEINHKLTMPVSFDFKKTPIRQVVDDLRTWTGIDIVLDKRALETENISMDQQIDIKVEGVSLKSALKNILHQLRLTYVIEGEVLKISTEAKSQGPEVLKTDRAEKRIIACPDIDFPSKPEVDLEFQVRNTGKQSITFFPDLHPTTFLAGPGALNITWPCQTGVGPGLGGTPVKPIVLKPGEKYSVRIKELKPYYAGSQSLWILPGEYSIYASCRMRVTPAPKGTKNGSSWITLRSQPLKVKVVNEEK